MACCGEEIGLFMHRHQYVDRPALDDIEHGLEIPVRIAPRRWRGMDTTDEARKAREAKRIARNEFNAKPRKSESGHSLSRRQAGAFAKQNAGRRPLRYHDTLACRDLCLHISERVSAMMHVAPGPPRQIVRRSDMSEVEGQADMMRIAPICRD